MNQLDAAVNLDGDRIEHTDIERAVAAKCPMEMGGYDSLEQLQRAWDTRHSDSAVGVSSGDAFDVEA